MAFKEYKPKRNFKKNKNIIIKFISKSIFLFYNNNINKNLFLINNKILL